MACHAGSKRCKSLIVEGSLSTRTWLQCELCQTPPNNQAGWVFMQVQWGSLGQCLDVWGKQVIQDRSYLQVSTLFHT